MTRQDALRLALSDNPTLKVALHQEREAWLAYKLAGRAPSASLSANYMGGTSLNNYGSLNQDVYAGVNENFQPFGNTAWSGRAAYRAYEIAEANVLQTRVTLIQNVKDAFIGLLVAQEQLHVAQENLKLANDVYDITKAKFKAGAGPKMDVLNAEITRATSVQAVIQADGTLRAAEATLAPLLGLSARDTFQAVGADDLPENKLVLGELLEVAKGHPQIVTAEKTLQQSEADVHVQRTQANPSVSLGAIYDLSTLNHNPNIYSVLGTVSIPIDWGQILYGVRQSIETVQEKRVALTGAQLAVVSNLKAAYENYVAAEQNALTYRASVLDPSIELLKMTEVGYKAGALPFQQLLLAEQNLRTARAQYFSLLLSGHQALDALEAAVGASLDTVPNKAGLSKTP